MKIYGIPNCTTIQKTLLYLDQNQLHYEFIDYKQNPPTIDEIKQYHEWSQLPITKFFNTSGILYREMNLKEKVKGMTITEVYQLLADHPMLIKRPLLIDNQHVLVGFEEVKYTELFRK